MDDAITVAVAADRNYVIPLAVCLRSLSECLPPGTTADVFILHDRIRRQDRERVHRSLPSRAVNLHWVDPPVRLLEGLSAWGHVTICTYFRLLLADALPADRKRVIYLDADTLVQADIGPLWKMNPGTAPLLAVEERGRGSPEHRQHLAGLGMDPDASYLNAGVMLCNLALWREEDLRGSIVQYIAANRPAIRWWDQDGLNAILEGRWQSLDRCWNTRVDILVDLVPDDAARILHFASSAKPWHYGPPHWARERFFACLDRTDWSGWRPSAPVVRLRDRVRWRFVSREHFPGCVLRMLCGRERQRKANDEG